MKIKQKHRDIATCYHRLGGFQFPLTDDDIADLFTYESTGRIQNGKPPKLLPGKAAFELQIWMVLEECFYYWAHCQGWALPIEAYELDGGDPIIVRSLRAWQAKADELGIRYMMEHNDNMTSERIARLVWMRK